MILKLQFVSLATEIDTLLHNIAVLDGLKYHKNNNQLI